MNKTIERIKYKLKDIKKKLQKKVFSFRYIQYQPLKNKIIDCFETEEHKNNEKDLDINHKAEGEKEGEIGNKR